MQILTQINPHQVSQGQQNVSVTLTGKNTSFAQGKTTADFGPGITVTSLTVTSPTTASALVNVDHAATSGFRTITLITGINRAQGDVPNSSQHQRNAERVLCEQSGSDASDRKSKQSCARPARHVDRTDGT